MRRRILSVWCAIIVAGMSLVTLARAGSAAIASPPPVAITAMRLIADEGSAFRSFGPFDAVAVNSWLAVAKRTLVERPTGEPAPGRLLTDGQLSARAGVVASMLHDLHGSVSGAMLVRALESSPPLRRARGNEWMHVTAAGNERTAMIRVVVFDAESIMRVWPLSAQAAHDGVGTGSALTLSVTMQRAVFHPVEHRVISPDPVLEFAARLLHVADNATGARSALADRVAFTTVIYRTLPPAAIRPGISLQPLRRERLSFNPSDVLESGSAAERRELRDALLSSHRVPAVHFPTADDNPYRARSLQVALGVARAHQSNSSLVADRYLGAIQSRATLLRANPAVPKIASELGRVAPGIAVLGRMSNGAGGVLTPLARGRDLLSQWLPDSDRVPISLAVPRCE